MKKLFLPLLLALALLLSACSLPVLPDGFFTTTTTGGGGDGGGQPSGPVYDDDNKSYGFYYDQLSPNEKAIYRAIYKGSREAADIPFALFQKITVVTQSDPETDPETADAEHATAISNAIKRIIQPAMDALAYDHPEIAWLAYGGEDGSSFAISLKSSVNEDGAKVAEIDSLTFQIKLKAPLQTKDDIVALEASINDAVTAITETVNPDAPRHEQLKALQEALSALVVYDKSGDRAHEAVGALLDGRAVCDGYAKSFKILCDAMGIPCVIVAGTATQQDSVEPHAWNYVQMEDGAYYAIDVTWNDDGEIASTDFFLVGADTVPAPGRKPFSFSHTPDGKFSLGDYPPFLFPTLSQQAYPIP